MAETIRQYGLPLVLALALHMLAALALYSGWNPQQETRVIRPQIVNSTLLVMEPKAKPKPQPAQPVTRPDPAVQRRQEQQARAEAEARARAEEQAQAKARAEAHAMAEAEARARAQELAKQEAQRADEQAARQQKLDALADAAFLEALRDEASELAEQSQAADSEAVAQSYRVGIYQTVVANWSRPPSARNGMQAKLLVELVPTGDVVAVSLLESSGNGAFDRSAEAAVRKARRFEVPKDPELFEQHFRRFSLLFRPEDLLR